MTYSSAGQHNVTASYDGDGTFTGSTTSTALSQTVNQAATATSLSSSVNPSAIGQTVTYTATVAVTGPGAGNPGGSVQFFDGSTVIPTCANVALTGLTATCAVTYSSAGAHPINATYGGDSNFSGSSASSPMTQNVGPTLASSDTAAVVGETVIYTATVSGPGVTSPGGSVQFLDNGTVIAGCASVSVIGPSAACPVKYGSASPATHPITAIYSGSFTGSVRSMALTETVSPAATTTVVSSSANPSVVGQPATYTATVAVTRPGSGTPTGSVTFVDGSTVLPGCVKVGLTGLIAVCHYTSANPGPHSITATYGGDSNYNPSPGSGTLPQTVKKAATTTTLSSSANPSVVGQPVTFTATVAVTGPGAGNPTGSVQFLDNGAVIPGCGNVSVSGSTTVCAVTYTSPSQHNVTVSYGGDGNFNGSTTVTALTQTVNRAATAITVASSANPARAGQTVSFTAVVAATSPGAGHPSGYVKFTDVSTPIAACGGTKGMALGATGTAICATGFTTIGNHSITATYLGDPTFAASTSAAVVAQVITPTNCSTFVGCQMAGANLNGVNLSGLNLSGANLSGANLQGANLSGANLSRANLQGANLQGANLAGSVLTSVTAQGANFQGANMTGAIATGADMPGSNLQKANLTNANFTNANLSGCNLQGATKTGAIFTGANLTGANL